jgi:hypothetical protein
MNSFKFLGVRCAHLGDKFRAAGIDRFSAGSHLRGDPEVEVSSEISLP